MSLPGPRFTYEDYLLLPEDKRYELIEGDFFMTPAPNIRHQAIVGYLFATLWGFVRAHGLGAVFPAPTDVVLSSENVVQPDVLFVSKEQSGIIMKGAIHGAPDLVVEILSPSTSSRDLVLKRKLYGRFGVQEYWIVDPDARTIEVLTPTASGLDTWRQLSAAETLTSPLLPGFSIPLAEVFAD
ncbi:MAG TPA: Uma2 family endonuclease [Symbiobacteriaceae bacterium]|nr:Uma2 family endonuclease [Symbiobacteriaceae bacterium]